MTPDRDAGPAGSAVEDAPCGYLVMDHLGRVVSVNATLSRWLGIPAAELEGGEATAIFGLASAVVFETSLLPLLRLQHEVAGVSLDLKARDGAKVAVMMSADTRGEGEERLTRLVMLKAGARRDFERELLQARADAEVRLSLAQRQGELREQFVAVLGHDLRNPLAAMSSGVRMLSRRPGEAQEAEILRLMQGSIQRMSRLIDNVLDFARNRLGGGIVLDLRSGDLEAAIRQAVDELRAAEPDRAVRLDLSLAHDVPCDVWRIGQLVSNLLGNALAHGDPEEPVSVEATTSAPGALEISVCNRGAPIPLGALEKLFDPFVKLGTEGRKGLGLGLYIASEIAKAHGGLLVVTSGDVIRFTFRMPAPAVEG
ncbi:PAS/PAC sensor signal transduction histidine kinase [Roseivivax lentus]|uniref:histidine kinase n=1 Tax=Roseivivax lentus TaxID=633194 RepID=A0A1N7NTH2_9RHOB|nr:PAS domain-containing sensor histidine kinase [Roseivivax lentus]SIT01519.1 PAS/PAC sensor signal transduction histidine kinase [Roseivivax lentus]